MIPSFLKMVAIATIADAVPLMGENRVFVSLGLEGLATPCQRRASRIVGNVQDRWRRRSRRRTWASGSRRALTLPDAWMWRATSSSCSRRKIPVRAKEVAEHLNKMNGDRQEEEARIMAAIDKQLADDATLKERYSLVLDGAEWHRGVIGICASRVVDRVHRPALVIARHEGEAHGSGRSIKSFHLLNALESCAELFSRFGGHAHAVGFALPEDRVAELRERLESYARLHLTPEDLRPRTGL